MTTEAILQAASDVEQHVVGIRRDLHRRPELGFQEKETAALVARELSSLPLAVRTGVYGTGVCALLQGSGPRRDSQQEKTILLRADMDALPIQEATGLPFSSQVPGVMHACGHDGHTAILLGTAMVLSRFREEIPGNVKFAFQPAEETEGGADGMIREGILEDPHVDAALGLHLWGSAARGIVEYKSGPLMASPDVFRIRITGKGGHAAMPHACIDPVPVAATIIHQLQTIISRRVDPLESAVISVCNVHAGNTHNVIPDEAVLEGTVRALIPEVREAVPGMIKEMARKVCEIYGAKCEVEYSFRYPPLINDGGVTGVVRDAAVAVLGAGRVREAEKPNMGGEDFAYFAQAVPSSFFYLGIAPDEDTVIRHHHPEFAIDESVLKDGIAVFCRAVLDFLTN